MAALGNPEVKKENFTDNLPRKKLPKVRRMPDDFKEETLLLSKWVKPRSQEEILKDIIPNLKNEEGEEVPLTVRDVVDAMKAFFLHGVVINEDDEVTVMDPDLRNLDTETIQNPMAVYSEMKSHMEKDVLNPRNIYSKDFFNEMVEAEYQSEIDVIDFSRENQQINESFKTFSAKHQKQEETEQVWRVKSSQNEEKKQYAQAREGEIYQQQQSHNSTGYTNINQNLKRDNGQERGRNFHTNHNSYYNNKNPNSFYSGANYHKPY